MRKLFSKDKKPGVYLTVKSACLMAGVLAGGDFLRADTLNVPGRDFPVACDVDVLVVGGTSGGVAAAVKAAQNGSRVFLMAQGPYLGEDICGAYHGWPDASGTMSGLAAKVLKSPAVLDYNRIPFTYETDIAAAAGRPDTKLGSKLTDGKKENADAVQYDASLNLIATLPEVQQVDRIKVYAFQKPNEFCALFVDAYVSNDKKSWEKVATQKDIEYVARPIVFSVDINRKAKFVKVQVKLAPQSKRMLVSEVEILGTSERKLEAGQNYAPTPLYVKRTLDTALLDAGVEFLYGCYPTDLLTDSQGAVRGVIMANRAGRQVVRAKTVIDATPNALLARLAGAAMRPENGVHNFRHTVVARAAQPVKGVEAKPTLTPVYNKGAEYPAFEYTVPFKTDRLDMHSYAEAQQQVLDKTWTPGQLSASEYIFEVPVTSVVSAGRYEGVWSENIPDAAFQSPQMPGVYLLNGYADVSRDCAGKLVSPANYMKTGEAIGQIASDAAKKIPGAAELVLMKKPAGESVKGELKETVSGVRPEQPVRESVKIGSASYPVLGEYDVVVVGGGTSGGPAAIGAARRGAKTLVIEYQHAFGGVGTVGLVGRYWYGYVKGFTAEMDEGLRNIRPKDASPIAGWDIQEKMEWYRREMRRAGAEMWMRSMAWGAVVRDGDVQGVAVSTPFGPGVVLAKVVVDATGNGDIAIPAGAKYEYLKPSRMGIQGVGLPTFDLGDHYNNSDFSVAYESDVVDQWHFKVYGKSEYRVGDAYDVSSLVDTRERRRIIGDYYLTVPDQISKRTFSDVIVKTYSDYDCHGVNYNKYVFLQPNPEALFSCVPYRCLLPAGLNGILVAGMGISVHHDALPLVRMQPDLQNLGYAAGVAAAMSAAKGIEPRDIDVKALQGHLVEIGNLPADVLAEKDSGPVPVKRIEQAVKEAPAEYGQREGYECSLILSHSEEALPLLRAAYSKAEGTNKVFYAHTLAVLEDSTGLDTLIAHVNGRKWDKGNNAPTSRMSEMDRLVISLGLPKDRRATAAIIQKINQLTPASDFTHFQAVAIALDQLKDPAAAPALVALLAKPGMTGHEVYTIEQAKKADQTALVNLGPRILEAFSYETRTLTMRELALARALYRCGDYEGVGKKILEAYTTDLRGVLAAHALSVLAEKPSLQEKGTVK